MSYKYEEMRHKVFTEEGVAMLIKAREMVQRAISVSGAVMASNIIEVMGCGDSWVQLAVIDYLIESRVIREVTPPETWGQNRVFVAV